NMATLEKLYKQVENIKAIAEENRQKENEAAVRIQSWFRGCQVRAYVSLLHKNATSIQKIWHGLTARALFRQRVKTAYFITKMNFYNKMAVKVNISLARYLEGLTRKNKHIRRDLEEVAELQWKERERITLEKQEKEKNIQAQRLHFLLSTKQCLGVFNSPFRAEPDETELRLRKVRPLLVRSAPKERKNPNITPDLNNLMPNRERLPPIHKKPQGPFRPALEVQQQRHRPLEPSLHVISSITALEEAREELKWQEWRTRIIDQTYVTHTHKRSHYEGLMHTSTPFEQVAYGTKHFREEHKEYLKGKKPFKTVFTTCHVFDKFGRLYSSAGNIV
uniref:Spermatogenesis associated 17 n=1 Tax=Cyprinus carpio TaxID=7962 RepID=A0A8C1J472_CYPCA